MGSEQNQDCNSTENATEIKLVLFNRLECLSQAVIPTGNHRVRISLALSGHLLWNLQKGKGYFHERIFT